MANVTIRDVAREAEVSITTVSQILRENARYQFHPNTVEKVRQAAERLGYQAHAAARLLRQQDSKMIGLAVQLSVHPHLSRLLIAVHDEIRRNGYEAVLCEPQQLIPTHSHAPFPSPEMLAGLMSLDLTMELAVPEFYENLQRKLPVIALYPVASSKVQTVVTDMKSGIAKMVQHLCDLGHRRLAITQFRETNHPSDTLKTDSWDYAVEQCGLDPGQMSRIFVTHSVSIAEMGPEIAAQLKALKQRPTALVTVSDEVALSAMGAISAMGWKIPGDISITGYDGIHFGDYCHPRLTTVVQDVDTIAKVAVQRMLELIRQGDSSTPIEPVNQWIEPTLRIGGSTAPPA